MKLIITILALSLLFLSVSAQSTIRRNIPSTKQVIKSAPKREKQNIDTSPKYPQINKDDPALKELENNMVYIRGGSFIMGGGFDREKTLPKHKVTLSSFYMCKYEVTQKLWYAVMGYNPSQYKDENCPVECVTWNDCQKFLDRLNVITGKKYRLPTEAEWEYAACSGGSDDNFQSSGCKTFHLSDEVAWYKENSNLHSHPVGCKLPNDFGLYDMLGNVQEWCQDVYSAYTSTEQTNPICTNAQHDFRVIRGGNCCTWNYNLYTYYRTYWNRDFRDFTTGFRIARH